MNEAICFSDKIDNNFGHKNLVEEKSYNKLLINVLLIIQNNIRNVKAPLLNKYFDETYIYDPLKFKTKHSLKRNFPINFNKIWDKL